MGLSDFLFPVTQIQARGGWGRCLVLATSLLRICQPQTLTDKLLSTNKELGTPRDVRDEPEHVPEAGVSSWPHILKALKFKGARPTLHCILGLVLVGQWMMLERTF